MLWWRKSLHLSLSRLAAWQGDVAQVEDGKWMSLCVENPALQGQQVVAGEQQVQIPEGGGGWGAGGLCVGNGGYQREEKGERMTGIG